MQWVNQEQEIEREREILLFENKSWNFFNEKLGRFLLYSTLSMGRTEMSKTLNAYRMWVITVALPLPFFRFFANKSLETISNTNIFLIIIFQTENFEEFSREFRKEFCCVRQISKCKKEKIIFFGKVEKIVLLMKVLRFNVYSLERKLGRCWNIE